MTVQLDWPPDVVNRLTQQARQRGLSLDEYLLIAVQSKESNEPAHADQSGASSPAREQAGRSIRELRKGNVRGPGLSIRDLIEDGRRF